MKQAFGTLLIKGEMNMDIYNYLGTLNYMKNHSDNRAAINAYWQMGCWAFGKDNLVKAAKEIDEYDSIKEFVK